MDLAERRSATGFAVESHRQACSFHETRHHLNSSAQKPVTDRRSGRGEFPKGIRLKSGEGSLAGATRPSPVIRPAWNFFEFLSFGLNPGSEVCLRVQAKAGRFNGEHRNETARTQKLRNGTWKGMLHGLTRL